MKKQLLLLLSLFLITSCGTFRVNAYNGMTEDEFRRMNVGEQMVYMEEAVTAYRMYSGASAGYLYYYFVNGKLTKIDQGQRSPDVIIQDQR